MNNDFNQIIDRHNTNSVKWDFVSEKLGLNGDNLLPMWVSDYDFAAPEAVTSALHQRVDHGVFGYSERDNNYFQAVIEWFHSQHDVQIKPEWLATIDGVLPGIAMLLQNLTQVGDGIVIQTPGYGSFNKIVELNQRVIIENPLTEQDGRYEMDLVQLEECFKSGAKMMILCNPHNPVGRAWGYQDIEAVATLCDQYGVWLISDEIWSDLAMPNHTFCSALRLPEALSERLIVATAASKTFGLSSLRISNFVIQNSEVKRQFETRMDAHGMDVSNCLSMSAATAAYRHCAPWLDELKAYLQGNIDQLSEFLAQELPQVTMSKPEAGYLAWIDCRALGLRDKEIEERCHAQGLIPSMGISFGKQGSGFIRLNLGCPQERLIDACLRLKAALN